MKYKVLDTGLGFGYAFEFILGSVKELGMRLPTWSKDIVVRIQVPTNESKMTHPYLYVTSRFGNVPWKETVVEMFSDKWQIVEIIEG